MGGWAQIADAAVRGQRADVQQNSRGALEFHAFHYRLDGCGPPFPRTLDFSSSEKTKKTGPEDLYFRSLSGG
jgi:hypothetical protein